LAQVENLPVDCVQRLLDALSCHAFLSVFRLLLINNFSPDGECAT
jgi:hypothetical protein